MSNRRGAEIVRRNLDDAGRASTFRVGIDGSVFRWGQVSRIYDTCDAAEIGSRRRQRWHRRCSGTEYRLGGLFFKNTGPRCLGLVDLDERKGASVSKELRNFCQGGGLSCAHRPDRSIREGRGPSRVLLDLRCREDS